jgi:hypothetical protein
MSTLIHTWVARARPATLWCHRLAQIHQFFVSHLWVILMPLAAPALLPFYTQGLPRSFDGGLHLLRISLLDRYIRQGVFFPRWTPELLLGHGYPLFNFYAPASYYFVELLHLIGLDLYAAFIAAFAFFVIAGGVGMYFLARDTFGHEQRGAALVAALTYLYGPYLLTNVYIRGAIAEAAAQALLPWLFWSVRRMMTAAHPARHLLPVVLSLGGLALTHNITLLFVPPLLLLYIALHWWMGGRRTETLIWVTVALVAAMGVSAFFWLPVLFERQYLTQSSLEMVKSVWLPGNLWRRENFLDLNWVYHYTFMRPIRLGLVQAILGVAGFVIGWRRNGEWLYWGFVALAAGLMLSAWSLSVWLASDLLAAAQFSWRLLSILSLPLALCTGVLVYHFRPGWPQTLATMALMALIIWAHAPRLAWIDLFDEDAIDASLPVFLQVEVDKEIIDGGTANASIQEFRPRWADETLELEPFATTTSPQAIEITSADAFGLQAKVANESSSVLRFSHYYFPGWRVLLDGEKSLPTYPSTNLGLLTVDLPPGAHTLHVDWVGTPLQRWSGWLSLLTLAALVGWASRHPHRWWRLATLLTLLGFGLVAMFYRPALAELPPPAQLVEGDGLRLLALRTENQTDAVYLYPYWQITEAPPESLRIRWQLQDSSGRVWVDLQSYPYFNTYRASHFAVGSLVDDGYQLPLPPGLPAGQYWVALSLGESRNELIQKPLIVGQVQIPKPVPAQTSPRQLAHVQVSNQARLVGFDLSVRGRPLVSTHRRPAVVRADAYLQVQLYWQALRPLAKNYHGFVHLVDLHGQPWVQEDQLPGPFFHPPLLWNPYRHVTDAYLLRLPEEMPSGLYWPAIGMYDFATLTRLPLYIDETSDVGYDYRLPPIKVLNPPSKQPDHRLGVEVHGLGELLGYDLSLSAPQVRVGEPFRVILYYRATQSTTTNYTRFLHFHDAARGMAAQQDGPPQMGVNPTSAWLPGEIVADPVDLVVSPESAPGEYTLYVGFYDAADGARLPLTQEGAPLADNRAPLITLMVAP